MKNQESLEGSHILSMKLIKKNLRSYSSWTAKFPNTIHVIEKSAIETLEKENKKYREALIERLKELQEEWREEPHKNENHIASIILGEIYGIKWAIEALERGDG